MPASTNSNSQLPGSSSSISANESPIDEINYDSDISEDDNAIAEGGDDDEYDDEGDVEDEEEPEDEGFAVEVNTLTGNTFNIMIHRNDTIEVLKTRIAFQEGISPADQNLLLDSSTGCRDNATVQEMNIDRHSKLTLVTNVASGVPYKTTLLPDNIHQNGNDNGHAGDSLLRGSPPSFKQHVPVINRNYLNGNNNGGGSNGQPNKNSSSSSSSSLRLPKILTSKHSTTYLDKNSNVIINGGGGGGGAGAGHRVNGHPEEGQQSRQRSRLNEREWMKSLFNKVVQKENDTGTAEPDDDDDYGSAAKVIIDMDSTTGGAGARTSTSSSSSIFPPRVSTRYIGTKHAPEEDGSILVVQGDDGVILIIQKNTSQLLDESFGEPNNNSRDRKHSNFAGKMMNGDGRIGRLGRYTQNNGSLTGGSDMSESSYRKNRYQEQDAKVVHEKIKENAVTLEKMRQVRGKIAQQKKERGKVLTNGNVESGARPVKTLEFPRLSERVGNKVLSVKNGVAVGYRSNGGGGGTGVGTTTRRSAVGRGGRSINSSKMSLNRLIAEIYLQSKRKDRHSFQPGQPPYTDQQLLRYVQLKTAILIDEQRKNKTEPCSRCQLDENWSYNDGAPYLMPTVVMNRYKRLANVRNSKSLDKEDSSEDELIESINLRRKSIVPVISSSNRPMLTENVVDVHRTENYIPRLLLVNREERYSGANRNTACSVATTLSNDSRRSSSKMTRAYHRFGSGASKGGGGSRVDNRNEEEILVAPDDLDEDAIICDRISAGSNGRAGSGGNRPALKVYPKMYSNSNGFGRSSSSRPGSSGKVNPVAKKSSVVRCTQCKKKIGIACRYQCRCGLIFCSTHRYPEAHECTFDYKTEGRNTIAKNNPVIVAQKIQEI